MFPSNIINTQYYKYQIQKIKIKIKGFVVLEGEKDSTIAIMDRNDYVNNFEEAIQDQITKGGYENKADTTLGNIQK